VAVKYKPKFRGPFQNLLRVVILTSSLAYKYHCCHNHKYYQIISEMY